MPAATLRVEGLSREVEILRDRWGIAHIYAQNEADLFFGQGYAAARDRLFQFEMWRRQATGTVAEILGPRELNRDIGTRPKSMIEPGQSLFILETEPAAKTARVAALVAGGFFEPVFFPGAFFFPEARLPFTVASSM